MRVDCIRVTHPYATLVSILLSRLPFGLHVLGLPLAFILSQDQTLHSISLKLRVQLSPSPSLRLLLIPCGIKANYVIVLGLIASLLSWEPTSQSVPLPFKNRLVVPRYRNTTGPLSITIYSKNVLKPFFHLTSGLSAMGIRFKLVVSLFSNPIPLIPKSVRFKHFPVNWECKGIRRQATKQATLKKFRGF